MQKIKLCLSYLDACLSVWTAIWSQINTCVQPVLSWVDFNNHMDGSTHLHGNITDILQVRGVIHSHRHCGLQSQWCQTTEFIFAYYLFKRSKKWILLLLSWFRRMRWMPNWAACTFHLSVCVCVCVCACGVCVCACVCVCMWAWCVCVHASMVCVWCVCGGGGRGGMCAYLSVCVCVIVCIMLYVASQNQKPTCS